MRVNTRVENGKAYIELVLEEEACLENWKNALLSIRDGEGGEVWSCLYPRAYEEPARGILLHPQLWNGMEAPCLYKAEAYLVDEEDRIVSLACESFALYTLEEIAGKGLLLNGRMFELHAVAWEWTTEEYNAAGKGEWKERILKLLREMGANAIFFPGEQEETELYGLCVNNGFLVLRERKAALPACGELFSPGLPFLTDAYYRHKALWSKVPFVHICGRTVKRHENGSFSLTVYSNQKKVALYVDGVLFEFRSGEAEYFFEEIPIKRYPVVLTAEAGGCNTALTIYERSQNFHKSFTFS